LGVGTNKIKSAGYPTMVSLLSLEKVSDVSCGFNHTLLLTNKKSLVGFGSNESG